MRTINVLWGPFPALQQSYFWPLALQSHFERVLEEQAEATEETEKKVWKKINLFFVVVEICVRIAGTNILGECSSFLKDIGCSAAWLAIGLLTRIRSKDDQFLFQAFLPVRFQVSSLVVFVLCSFIRCQISEWKNWDKPSQVSNLQL